MDKHIYGSKQRILLGLLRKLREEADLPQSQLAKRLGRPQSFVSKYESGERRLDILELREICHVLKTSLPVFIDRLETQIGSTIRR